MSTNIKTSILTLTLLLAGAGPGLDVPGTSFLFPWGNAHAQTPKYPYKQYENRKEGIIKSRQLVAGESLVLVAAAIENGEPTPMPASPDYKLAFCLKDSSKLEIVVREFEKLYKMVPLRTEYPAGVSTFAWPAAIPRFYKIEIPHLLPLATVAGTAGERIVPVAIFSAAPKSEYPVYRFCFVPLKSISVLNYKIYRAGSLELIYSGALRDIEQDTQAFLRWPARDQNNKPVRSGLYKLFLEATFRPLPGEQAAKVALNYEFYHDAELLKSNQLVR
jgi:hypothetical protein